MDVLPDKNASYKEKEYWDQRYRQDTQSFDWFRTFKDIAGYISPFMRKQDSIVMLGCGNSTLSSDLYEHGWQKVVNLDYSDIVIESMSAKLPQMEWRVGDILDTQWLKDGELFDVAIDKGTMDALMTDETSSWSPSEALCVQLAQYVDNVYNILEPGGRFIYVTFGQPHFRRRHLVEAFGVGQEPFRQRNWKCETIVLSGEGFDYFMYVCTK
jgi:SAM-dependent methyltransferase